ncbi:hypothetical protein BOTBODRAFT_495002 [Botryobasidium botryosum FD-172 SS1]|uniref:Uncharacterized protein n=1 Tax=Botryobasidium botryosum (strain FD-172 SS1) TaxID=930990 RepID=A0A067M4C4_BOTB1|nr:hypothetical protein BOTBODRAFT_495002 [Botryobasidium botryosum FD-172 SS1]
MLARRLQTALCTSKIKGVYQTISDQWSRHSNLLPREHEVSASSYNDVSQLPHHGVAEVTVSAVCLHFVLQAYAAYYS